MAPIPDSSPNGLSSSATPFSAILGDAIPARREPVVERDEILDGRTRIIGYRFRIACPEQMPNLAPAVKLDTLRADNLAAFAQHRLAVVPISAEEWGTLDYRQFVTPNTVFHVAAPSANDGAGWREALAEIKRSGGGIAIDTEVIDAGFGDALELADMAVVRPIRYSSSALEKLIGDLRQRHRGINVAADGVASWHEYRACLAMGAHYCLGPFTASPYADDDGQRKSVLDDVLDRKLVQFSWYRVFECGQPDIDREHHELFILATDLLNAVIGAMPGTKVMDLVDALLRKAAEHFADEEAIISAAGYPRARQHAGVHHELTEKATRLVADFKAGKVEIAAVFQFLAHDLIVNHMLGADRDFFPLFAKGNGDAAADPNQTRATSLPQ